jgi:dolichol-phosphate mannosyltransferase
LKPLVLMPTYNEAETLERTISDLFRFNSSVDLMIIDDNSPDGTGAIADRLARSDRRISVTHRHKRQGLGAAYRAGFQKGLTSNYSHFIEMDADGSHQSIDLKSMLESSAGSDLVIGSRWVDGGEVSNWSEIRKAISKIGNRYAGFMLKSQVADMTSGFRIYSKELLQQLPLDEMQAHGYAFQVEMTMQAEARAAEIREVPICFVERDGGRSKMSFWIVVEAFWLCTKWGLRRRLSA